VFLECGFK